MCILIIEVQTSCEELKGAFFNYSDFPECEIMNNFGESNLLYS